MRKVTNSAAHAPFSCHDSGHGSSACLNSQNNHPPHGTPSFMAFPTYKLGCDRRCIPMVSMINSTSCQSTLSSTSPWHTAGRIDFLFFRSSSYAFGFFRTASNPFTNLLVLCPKPRLAQKQQHKQQHQQQQQQPSSRPSQSLSKTSPGWVLTGCNFNEVRTRCERGPNEVRNQILGD